MTIDAEGGWKAEERTGSRPRTPRVLVAEDDPAMRDLCVQSLRRDGYEVVEAASGAEAVAIMEDVSTREWSTDAIDLVLTDVRMPGLSGVRLGEMIRKARWPIPVILMTAFPDAAVEAEAGRLQLALLAKPFRLELMRRIVLTTLAAHVRARNSSSVEVPGAVAK